MWPDCEVNYPRSQTNIAALSLFPPFCPGTSLNPSIASLLCIPSSKNSCLRFQGTLGFSPPWCVPSPRRNTMSTPLPITDHRGNSWNTAFSPALPSRWRRLSLQSPPKLFHRAPPNSPSNSSLNSQGLISWYATAAVKMTSLGFLLSCMHPLMLSLTVRF